MPHCAVDTCVCIVHASVFKGRGVVRGGNTTRNALILHSKISPLEAVEQEILGHFSEQHCNMLSLHGKNRNKTGVMIYQHQEKK